MRCSLNANFTEEGGVIATIFFHRVEAVTRGGTVSKVLGNAIAHEFGHLLLGRKAHAPIGIMQPHWTRDMLKLADRGLLHFTLARARGNDARSGVGANQAKGGSSSSHDGVFKTRILLSIAELSDTPKPVSRSSTLHE